MRASRPCWRRRWARVDRSRPVVGQVADRPLAGQPLQDAALLGGRARRQRPPGRRAAGPAARWRAGRDRQDGGPPGAPGRGRGGPRRPTAAPGWSGSPARRRRRRPAGRGGRVGRSSAVTPSVGASRTTSSTCRVAASSSSRARSTETGTASRLASATTSDGAGRATSGRATSSALSCSSLRVRSQAASVAGGPEASGPRYVVAATGRSCQHGPVLPAADDPPTRAALAAHQAGALRWLGGGVIAVVLGVLLGVAAVALAGRTAVPGAGVPFVLLVAGRHVRGRGRHRRSGADRPLARGAGPPGRGARAPADRRAGGALVRAGGVRRARSSDEPVRLQLLSTAVWRTRAVQRLDGAEVRAAPRRPRRVGAHRRRRRHPLRRPRGAPRA